ncbi:MULTISPECIES: LysR family transcriptional regulator [Pantoea]|jgi:DNA-binding transcriptional LysR family regulator|uniref:LysR family transcriptional regulator n=1 Tax=Pantoea TaxID=53335 RepID=UPI00117ED4EC|nr:MULTISPECIES: LysR family transcriptional regulator [Pantoea]TSH79088.1 LysR family transcriptional regulator [Pantoea sp. paga]
MNHTSLEIFRIVAEELSIVKAAKRLGRVQSNITTRIQQLEEELDTQLFIRENKRLRLSPQGKQFLIYTKKILSLAQEARQSLHPTMPGGTLSLGTMECTAASRLAEPLAAFSKACPDVRVSLSTHHTQLLTEKVMLSELDCALVALPLKKDGEVVCPDNLSFQPLFTEELLLVLPTGMNLIRNLGDISEGRLAAFARGCTYREIATAVLAKMAGSGKQVQIQEVSSYHSMLACVASGSYMCMLPQSVLDLMQLPDGLSILPAGSATTQLIWRKDYSSPAMDKLLRLLQNTSNISA